MLHPPRPIDWLMLGFLCLAWGLAFLLTAIGLELFPPLTLVAIRLMVGAVVLYLIMRWQGHRLPRREVGGCGLQPLPCWETCYRLHSYRWRSSVSVAARPAC